MFNEPKNSKEAYGIYLEKVLEEYENLISLETPTEYERSKRSGLRMVLKSVSVSDYKNIVDKFNNIEKQRKENGDKMMIKESKTIGNIENINSVSYYGKLRKCVINNSDWDHPNYWVFYHTDADGNCSGTLVYLWLTRVKNVPSDKIHMISTDYSVKFEKYDIQENDCVFFVDLSFTEATSYQLKAINDIVKNNICWIDHHESNVDLLNNDNELDNMVNNWKMCVIQDRKNLWSAAMLVYCSLFNVTPMDGIPYYIQLVSDWDTWRHDLPESIYFNKGVNSHLDYKILIFDEEDEILKINNECVWFKLYDETVENDFNIVHDIIETAKPVVDSERVLNSRYLKSNGFETTIFGYKVLACNQRSNSLLFGDKIDEYDMVCPFVCHQRNGKLIYTYSLFSSKDDINCKDIAEKFGGGGHKKAAGFSLDFNLFTTNKHILKFKLLKNKLKRR